MPTPKMQLQGLVKLQGIILYNSQYYTWAGLGINNNFTTTENWWGSIVPTSNTYIQFGDTIITSPNNDSVINTYFSTIEFLNSNNNSFTINGNQLLAGNIINNSNYPVTLNVDISSTTLSSTTINCAISDIITNGTLTGPGTFIKQGTGTLTISGAFTGNTFTVNNGTLTVNTKFNNGFAPTSNSVTVNNGGTLKLGGSGKIADNTIVTINNGGIYYANGFLDNIGGITGTGTMFADNGAGIQTFSLPQSLTFDGKFSGSELRFNIQNTSTLNIDNTPRIFTITNPTSDCSSAAPVWLIGGNVSNAANLGDTTLKLGANNVIPSSYVIKIWGSSAASGPGSYQNTLDLNGTNQTIIGLSYGYVTAGGTKPGIVTNKGLTDSTLTLNNTSNLQTFSGIIKNGSTNKISLIKDGTAVQELSGTTPNTYTGSTQILGTGALTIYTNSLSSNYLNKINYAQFKNTTLTVNFGTAPLAGEKYILLSGPTGNTYSPVNLQNAPGRSASYDSPTSTLTII